MNRRDFLAALLHGAGLAGGLATDRVRAAENEPSAKRAGALPLRSLGRTGRRVTALGLGGHHLGLGGSERAARRLVEAALEEGIRFFDTAESYQNGRSESWLGAALRGMREEVFLMTKTHAPESRSAESALRHLEGSLERLGTDRLDLWQLHSIKSVGDVDRAFAAGGAMEAILKMKEKGVVRHVGVTGHRDPEAHVRALHHFDRGMKFDTMQMPLNPVDRLQASFQKAVLPGLTRRGIGVIAMKTSASGSLLRGGLCDVEECLRYALSLPVAVAVVGMEDAAAVRENAGIVRDGVVLSESERDALHERLRPRASLDLEWYKKR